MILSKLIEKLNPIVINDPIDTPVDPDHIDITSIHYNSRDVKPGGLFIAITGHKADGHDFIEQAIENGAVAIVSQKSIRKEIINIKVKDSREALAEATACFYDYPSKDVFLVGITGTNGKTTTTYLIESIFAQAGYNVGGIGTINYRYSGKSFVNPMTTPESLELQRILSEMAQAGVTRVIVEVSSHSIDLKRIHQCYFDIGVFTNLSQDHLDYHGDIDSYWACKKTFFAEHLNNGPKTQAKAVINANDPHGQELIDGLNIPCYSIGFKKQHMIRPVEGEMNLGGINAIVETPSGSFSFKSQLVGKYNLENILCAIGVGIASEISLETIQSGIERVSNIPGRLETIIDETGRFVYIDYAHTPDALENVLLTLKSMAKGRVICIFGCGGDRDRDKRPQMGRISGDHSDLSVITSDNPRSEDPQAIIDHIVRGIQPLGLRKYTASEVLTNPPAKGYVIEPDRKKAINLGIKAALPGDTVLIAGKGHETYQIIGDKTLFFDDRIEAQKALY